jgi:hypothetical protein
MATGSLDASQPCGNTTVSCGNQREMREIPYAQQVTLSGKCLCKQYRRQLTLRDQLTLSLLPLSVHHHLT